MTSNQSDEAVDGRLARTRRTSEAIARAFLQLVATERRYAPTSREIAEVASVSARSVYLHFPERSELLGAAVDYHFDDLWHLRPLPDDGRTLVARWIESAIEQQTMIWALYVAALTLGEEDSLGTEIRSRWRCLTRAAVAHHFRDRLRTVSAAEADRCVWRVGAAALSVISPSVQASPERLEDFIESLLPPEPGNGGSPGPVSRITPEQRPL